MNLTKCKNGHYYDADKYSSCPHCGNNSNAEDDVTVNMEQTSYSKTAGGSQSVTSWTFSPASTGAAPAQVTPLTPSSPSGGPIPLNQAVSAAAGSSAASMDDDKTVSYYGGTLETEPVVGWLVCIEGKLLGKAFELKNGKNFIGRSPQMDIVLEGDANVSRDRHAIVTYEPKGRMFFAQPGEARELFYVNDQVVLMNVVLNDRDVISVGKTQLMFIPLCGPEFSWDDLKK